MDNNTLDPEALEDQLKAEQLAQQQVEKNLDSAISKLIELRASIERLLHDERRVFVRTEYNRLLDLIDVQG